MDSRNNTHSDLAMIINCVAMSESVCVESSNYLYTDLGKYKWRAMLKY